MPTSTPINLRPLVEEAVGDAARTNELRSPGARFGPEAGGGIESFLDVVAGAKDLVETLAIAYLVAKHLKAQTGGVRISARGIELLSRRELDARGHAENVTLVTISLIPIKSELSGPPPGFLGYAAVFRLGDGRLVTMRWSLDGLLEDYSEGS